MKIQRVWVVAKYSAEYSQYWVDGIGIYSTRAKMRIAIKKYLVMHPEVKGRLRIYSDFIDLPLSNWQRH